MMMISIEFAKPNMSLKYIYLPIIYSILLLVPKYQMYCKTLTFFNQFSFCVNLIFNLNHKAKKVL